MNIQRAETMNRLMRDHQDNWERMSAEEDALEMEHLYKEEPIDARRKPQDWWSAETTANIAKAYAERNNYREATTERSALENQHKGGSTDSQYKLPSGATQLQDLIEYRDMSFSLGNIFKACYRLGAKESVTVMYDLKKIQWFVERMIAAEEDK